MHRLEAWFLLFACGLLAATALAQPAPSAYLVVAHASNPASSVTRKFLSDAFLKKVTRWQSGVLIRPVDQDPDAGVRRKFSEEVLNRSVTAVRSYWQQVIFAGRDVPPPELSGDAAVIEYVSKHEGAVGYVSGGTATGSAKVLPVR